jgi:hypothetical protein
MTGMGQERPSQSTRGSYKHVRFPPIATQLLHGINPPLRANSGLYECAAEVASSPVAGLRGECLGVCLTGYKVGRPHGGKAHRGQYCNGPCRGCQGFLRRHSRNESRHGSRLDIDFRSWRGRRATDQHRDRRGDRARRYQTSPSRWIISTRSISVFSLRDRRSNTVPQASRGASGASMFAFGHLLNILAHQS